MIAPDWKEDLHAYLGGTLRGLDCRPVAIGGNFVEWAMHKYVMHRLVDVYALRAPGARTFAATSQAGVCLMHMQGEPRTMQESPRYDDVVTEVCEFLARERDACIAAGIARQAIVIDPGIGFGKGLAHNMMLLRELSRVAALNAPLLVGVSRKSFIGRILGRPVDERLYGGLGLAALAVANGARIIRTHDVAATRDAIDMVSAVVQGIDT